MNIPSQFDPIRPFEPEELPEAYERLIADPQFRTVIGHIFSSVPFEAVAQKIRACKTNIEFQHALCYPFLKNLVA